MCNTPRMISLGFAEDEVPAGTHMCLVFTDEEERTDCLLKFLLSGLSGDERVACFSDRITEDEVRDFMARHGISYDERRESGAVMLSGTGEVYFAEGRFEPERMLAQLKTYYAGAMEAGFAGARVIGEMSPEVEDVPGGERLLEYESRVTMLTREVPMTSVCQYDAREFDGATIMEVLRVHPAMLVHGAVVRNPFYIEPEEYLGRLGIDV